MQLARTYTKRLQESGHWPLEATNVHPLERALCALIGGAMLAAGAHAMGRGRHRWHGVALLMGASVALVRALRGRSRVYQAAGINTARPELRRDGLPSAPTQQDAKLDDMIDDSFPASDPPAY